MLELDITKVKQIIADYPTPFYLYDENGIVSTAQSLNKAFTWQQNGFTNYFAVKALPNPEILKLLKQTGMGVDCSSLAELIIAERCGFKGEQIMFSSNDTSKEEFVKAYELGAIINLDDISHISFVEEALGKLPDLLCFRFNPGPERVGNQIIGNPSEAKFGLTREQLLQAYKDCLDKGVSRFGLHTMLASNELDISYFIETAQMLFEIAVELTEKLEIKLEFINLGGGLGIPYLPEQMPLDLAKLAGAIEELYSSILKANELEPKLFMECGRYVTGPHGYLVSTVLHLKNTYREYVGLDASMANLMRPGMYGSYHHMTVLGKENEPLNHSYDVTGSLCENNDKFAIQRPLPKVETGDIVVIHDTGAHGHSMGFNYNGKLRSAEILLQKDGNIRLVRRAETLDDYFATLSFDKNNE
jgi:diaminopimelate decarboxylase